MGSPPPRHRKHGASVNGIVVILLRYDIIGRICMEDGRNKGKRRNAIPDRRGNMVRVRFRLFPQGKIRALTVSYDDVTVHDRRLVEICNRRGEESDGGRLWFAGPLTPRHGGETFLAGGIAHPGSV